MATYKGINKTIVDNITPATVLDPGLAAGNVRVMIDQYTGLGTEVAASIIEMGDELPVGAKVIDVICSTNDATVTLDVGDYEDTNRYISTQTANTISHTDEVAGLNYEVDMTTAATPDNQIILTTAAATLTINKIIQVAILYTVE